MTLRPTTPADAPAIADLYRRVSAAGGGLARTPEEITEAYVAGFVAGSLARGVALVAVDNTADAGRIIGELHAYGTGLRAFAHVLGDLTVAVDPAFQGRGIGRQLFTVLLTEVPARLPHISRVELLARESNVGAIGLYESVGFRREGRLAGRIAVDGRPEADIPMAWHPPGTPPR